MALTNTADMQRHQERQREAIEFRKRFANRETTEKEENEICSRTGESYWRVLINERAMVDRAREQATIDAKVPEVIADLRQRPDMSQDVMLGRLCRGIALLIEQMQAESLARRAEEKNVSV